MPLCSKMNLPSLLGSKEEPSFSDLPYELRRKIWLLALPGPRVLHIVRKPGYVPSSAIPTAKPTVTAASYGLYHPAILSVNHESRYIALSKLTEVFGVYWNLEIDAPYFEIKDNSDDAVDLLAQLRKAGYLDPFKNIVIDWMLWSWERATRTMEFRVTFRNRFDGYEQPLETLKYLTNIKKCTFVYTEHTLQKDIVDPYQAWKLGPLTEETTMFEVGKMAPKTNWDETLEQTATKIESEVVKRKGEAMREDDLQFDVMAIHDGLVWMRGLNKKKKKDSVEALSL
ncbi:hypothetical protein EG329_000970 [Mollisiaceae sp. DMI_Dod_QoI]|nr:hypothetical protein EG329_000970 [Helotiales sp. DMI_Dod_QoI]